MEFSGVDIDIYYIQKSFMVVVGGGGGGWYLPIIE